MTAAGVDVSELLPDLFEGVDEVVRRTRGVVSNFSVVTLTRVGSRTA